MKVLIISDIFGINESFKALKIFIEKLGFEVRMLSPYEKKEMFFKDEDEAYKSFINLCGHNKYLDCIKKELTTYDADFFISFSAGASAAYRISEEANTRIKEIMCFYPSQIRNHLHLNPKKEVFIVFAQKEKSFDVKEVSSFLFKKDKVSTQIFPYLHGFMNHQSVCFNEKAKKEAYELIKNRLFKYV